jgi:hypothetical protein
MAQEVENWRRTGGMTDLPSQIDEVFYSREESKERMEELAAR